MGGSVAALAAAVLAIASPGAVSASEAGRSAKEAREPSVDRAREPFGGLALGLGVQRFHEDFGVAVRISSPRMLRDHLSWVLSGGLGWYPDLRALPESSDDQDFGAWSLYGHARLGIELSTRVAESAARMFVTLGPSILLLSERLSTDRLAVGAHGSIGIEVAAGDAYRTYPFALYAEMGAVAHAAAADVVSRTGAIEKTDATVDRPIATGFLLSGGVRVYLWR